MITAVFFSNSNIIDQLEIRLAVMRIPEVISKLRQAQKMIDSEFQGTLDLYGYLGSEDSWFLKNTYAKSLATAIVQIGLYERFLKSYPRPQFIIGNCKGDSPLNIAAGQASFEELVRNSQALRSKQHLTVVEGSTPVLLGVALAEYVVYEADQNGFVQRRLNSPHVRHILCSLIEENSVKRLVNIGSAEMGLGPEQQVVHQLDVQYVNSIELDPMLTWFMQPQKMAH